MAASTPYRRTGCSVISTTSSGFMQDSSMATPSRIARYSGSDRPAWRMYQTGVWSTGSPRTARRKALSCGRRSGLAMVECSHRARRVRTSPTAPRLTVSAWSWEARPALARVRRRSPRSSSQAVRADGRRPGCARRCSCEPMPAPQRIAPYASALSADVTVDGNDVSTGRLILLHDPDGNDSWDGTFRCVAYARAEIDLEMITDPALADVGWTWLTEALAAHGAAYTAASGHDHPRRPPTASARWPTTPGSAQIEIRASWTPESPTTALWTSPPTSRPGASSCARRPDCRRSPRA